MPGSVLARDLLFLMGLVISLSSLVNGAKTGSASSFVHGGFQRSEQPFLYWMAMTMSGAACVVCLFFLIADAAKLI
jgi:hypothetical protein